MLFRFVALGTFFISFVSISMYSQDYTSYVNPLIGSDSEFSFSNGNTYPAIAQPWGMHFWAPQTSTAGDGWFYKYDDYKINGIKQTHQPSPWLNDYGSFALMATVGETGFLEEDRESWFSHKAEHAKPHHYSVYLADYHTTLELTTSSRAAHFQVHFPETDSANIVLDTFPGMSRIEILPDQQAVIGYSTHNHGGVADNFKNYFVLQFDQPFSSHKLWVDSNYVYSIEASAHRVGAIIRFSGRAEDPLNIRVASSFISTEQAWQNLKREMPDTQSFDESLYKAKTVWEKELGKIRILEGDLDAKRTFYSALYRLLLFPRPLHEITTKGDTVHYSPYTGKMHEGFLYTDNGFWDTFRAVFPFFTLMYPDLNSQIMQGLVNTYKQSGWLPEWASPGHRGVMIGSNSASIIADSWLKGIRGYDMDILYEAIIKNTKGHGPVTSVGRYGAEWYNRLGYVPYDVGVNESAARSLEYAYADFCIWQLAKDLGKSDEEQQFYYHRAKNYKHLFDPQFHLMRGKNEDGSWQEPFNPFKWGDAFTEGNSWHYTWSVFQDVEGLIKLFGGDERFIAALDSVFAMPPVFDDSYYGFPIHEIREMQVADFGQYAHGNQPIQHMIYLYHHAGAPHKGQFWLKEVMNRLYQPTPDGYAGDEDNGQTSAWYVWSALGMYPVTPGTDEYVLGSPLFEKVEIDLPSGNTLVLEASEAAKEKAYVRQIKWNDQLYRKLFFKHHKLLEGGHIQFELSDEKWGREKFEQWIRPYSMSRD